MAIEVTYDSEDNIITVTGGTEGTPATFADIQAANDAGGWGVCSNPFTGCYKLDAHLDIGDGVASTYFTSTDDEYIFFSSGNSPQVKNNATLQLGTPGISYSGRGVSWVFEAGGYGRYFSNATTSGVIYMYNVHLRFSSSELLMYVSSLTIKNTTITADDQNLRVQADSGSIYNLYIWSANFLLKSSLSLDLIHTEDCTIGIVGEVVDITAENLLVTNAGWVEVRVTTANILTLKNPLFHPTLIRIDNAGGIIKEQYTCNIHIADKDGNDISGATVTCQDKDGNQVFSVQTGADGKIAEQTITYKKWEGTDETETTYSPHKFTISKTGRATFTIDNVTVDKPIDWHLEWAVVTTPFMGLH